MLFQPSLFLQLRLLQTLMVVVMLLSLLVSGSADQKDDESLLVVGINARSPVPQEKQRLRHSFGVFFSSKRKVPNAADPLHNR
ncbi:hypothetical protein GQ457_16G015090 [Hibiscus cannabinus]